MGLSSEGTLRYGEQPVVHVPRDAAGPRPFGVYLDNGRDPVVGISGREQAPRGQHLVMHRQVGGQHRASRCHRLEGRAAEAHGHPGVQHRLGMLERGSHLLPVDPARPDPEQKQVLSNLIWDQCDHLAHELRPPPGILLAHGDEQALPLVTGVAQHAPGPRVPVGVPEIIVYRVPDDRAPSPGEHLPRLLHRPLGGTEEHVRPRHALPGRGEEAGLRGRREPVAKGDWHVSSVNRPRAVVVQVVNGDHERDRCALRGNQVRVILVGYVDQVGPKLPHRARYRLLARAGRPIRVNGRSPGPATRLGPVQQALHNGVVLTVPRGVLGGPSEHNAPEHAPESPHTG